MAGKNDEHKMLFDIRGRRKNVVKVVYAVLALLMGVSLFLVVGPAPLSEIFGGGSSSTSAASQFEEQTERIEQRLKKDPEDPDLLLNLTRAQINAGNALAETIPATGAVIYTPESRLALEEASETWAKYLKATNEPSPTGAQLVAQAQFGLAQYSRTGAEALVNVKAAAAAQQIVAEVKPSLGSSARWRSSATLPSTTTAPRKRARKPRNTPPPSSNAKASTTNSTSSRNAATNSKNSWPKQKKKRRKPANRAEGVSPTRSAEGPGSPNRQLEWAAKDSNLQP